MKNFIKIFFLKDPFFLSLNILFLFISPKGIYFSFSSLALNLA